MKGKVRKIFPKLSSEWLQVVSTTISSYSPTDYSWIIAALQKDFGKFQILSKHRLQLALKSPTSKEQKRKIKEFWFLMQTVLVPVLKEVRDILPVSFVSLCCSQASKYKKDSPLELRNNQTLKKTSVLKIVHPKVNDVLSSTTIDHFYELLPISKKFKILGPGQEEYAMEERLTKLFPQLRSDWLKVVAITLCSYFLSDYP